MLFLILVFHADRDKTGASKVEKSEVFFSATQKVIHKSTDEFQTKGNVVIAFVAMGIMCLNFYLNENLKHLLFCTFACS